MSRVRTTLEGAIEVVEGTFGIRRGEWEVGDPPP
jgi:hypothetical protein